MDTRDVLTVLKVQPPTARAILRTFKTSSAHKSRNALAFKYIYVICQLGGPYSEKL